MSDGGPHPSSGNGGSGGGGAGGSAANGGPARGGRSGSGAGGKPTVAGSGSGDGGGSAANGDAGDAASGGNGSAPDDGGPGGAPDTGTPRTESPWGVAPSHSSSLGIASWASVIAESGIDWIRGFDQASPQTALPIATANGFQVSGIIAYSAPGGPASFPVDDLPGLRSYVNDRIEETRGIVKHWEVWNEPPNFSENKSPADYAKIVIAAYDAAKAADPTVQVGLAAQSVNLNFMAQALDAGAVDHFDYVTVHPYETLGMVDAGWEAQYMSIVPTIRKLLADKNPAKRDVSIWFTELGEPVANEITPEHQADTLVKAYVMGIAQGAHRIHWFEPLDGDSGPFGLIGGGSGTAPKRPVFTAVATLIAQLGKLPSYLGWLLLNDAHYAFVFDGASGPVMVAWSGQGITDTVDFGASVHTVDLHTGTSADLSAVELSHSPLLIAGVPERFATEARGHASQPLPWAGDYSAATSVSDSAADGSHGLHPVGAAKLITLGGDAARDISQGPGQAFTVDPSFCSYTATRLRITAVVRRNTAAPAGFNVKYESTSGWKGTGSWYDVPGDDQWYTQSWTIDDPQFVGKWGYNFAFDSDSTQHSNYSIRSVTVAKE
jgi:polysaccharide biosynthesis protein PslG